MGSACIVHATSTNRAVCEVNMYSEWVSEWWWHTHTLCVWECSLHSPGSLTPQAHTHSHTTQSLVGGDVFDVLEWKWYVCVERERARGRCHLIGDDQGALFSWWIRGSFRLKRTFVRVFQLPQRLDWEKGERKWQRDYSSINQKKEYYQRCTFSIHFFTVFLFGTLNTGGNSLLN